MNAKKLIKQAAYRLFETKPFEKVTVQDILDEAEVSRGTFYHHFSDKYELVYAYYEEEIAGKALSEFYKTDWETASLRFFDFLDERRQYFKNASGDPHDNDSLTNFMYRFNVDTYRQHRLQATGKPVLSEAELLTIKAFSAAMICIFNDYLKGRSKLSKEEYVDIIKQIVPKEYR